MMGCARTRGCLYPESRGMVVIRWWYGQGTLCQLASVASA